MEGAHLFLSIEVGELARPHSKCIDIMLEPPPILYLLDEAAVQKVHPTAHEL